ncbi:PPP family 3-phenylpropionic acid transporter [Psychrobacillus insolitus]|uniref:PPP family 3-phenylpropionic acid transporter n=1 Tax=Psychrobacillus insolitus TaxID=1461 RepID=A0A2W7N4Y0_9BACI|nr:MFS transporter [Psychrobacillus insolitus]PZX07003.1 PPP family 3-phenylpropionic acid transporter [Psychrobacillus insolitus]
MKAIVLLKSYNFMFFGLLALFIPFLPVYLSKQGLSTSEIGLIIGTGGFVTLIAQPLWGLISDKKKTVRKVMLLLVVFTTIFGYFLFSTNSFLLLGLFALLVYFFLMPLDPLTESLNFTVAEKAGISYGSIRTYGALGYAVLSLITGFAMDYFGVSSLAILFVLLGFLSFGLVWFMPDVQASSKPVSIEGLKKVFSNKEMILFLALVFISAVPARMNDTFLGIHIQSLGGDATLVGIAFFLAAISEIVIFALSFWWLRKGKELEIITIATFFYFLRFFASGFVTSPVVLTLLQVLQMLTFPIFYTAAIQYLYQIMPKEWRATGQTVLALLFFGLSSIIASYVGGFLYTKFGGHSFYFLISAMSFIGVLFGIFLTIRKYRK